MKCVIDGCDHEFKLVDRQLCAAHYARYLRHGDNFDKSPIKNVHLTLNQRLKSKVKISLENKCHEWQGALSKKGYGVIGIGSRLDKTRKIIYCHRVSYEINNGNIPKGMLVLHRCDNPKCINPQHLFLGTAMDNTNDMISKNRAFYQKKLTALP